MKSRDALLTRFRRRAIVAAVLLAAFVGCDRMLITTMTVAAEKPSEANVEVRISSEDIETVKRILRAFADEHGFVADGKPADAKAFAAYEQAGGQIERELLATIEDGGIVVSFYEFAKGVRPPTGYGSLKKDLIRRLKEAFPDRVRVSS